MGGDKEYVAGIFEKGVSAACGVATRATPQAATRAYQTGRGMLALCDSEGYESASTKAGSGPTD
jgi:hypothetical protein